jgi:hypothetical protein
MSKLIYLLWSRGPMNPADRRRILLDECAPKLLQIGLAGLQMNIADDLITIASPAPRMLGPKPFVAQVNLWLDDPAQRQPCEEVLRAAGFDLAGYRVDEWLYTDYGENAYGKPRDWPDGQRSPGLLAVTLLERPKSIPRDEWMRRWFGWQSPMSEWMQPRARYVRNVVEEVLTPGVAALDGIVEEAWPSEAHVTNKLVFFGARNRLQLIRHMAIMLRSVSRIFRMWKITTVMMSEYFLKTPGNP